MDLVFGTREVCPSFVFGAFSPKSIIPHRVRSELYTCVGCLWFLTLRRGDHNENNARENKREFAHCVIAVVVLENSRLLFCIGGTRNGIVTIREQTTIRLEFEIIFLYSSMPTIVSAPKALACKRRTVRTTVQFPVSCGCVLIKYRTVQCIVFYDL